MGKKDPRTNAYIAKAAPFARPILGKFRDLVHAACPETEEAIKWGAPFFMYKEKILVGMAAFKQHCSIGFGSGQMRRADADDPLPEGLARCESIENFPKDSVVLKHIKAAMKARDTGATTPRPKPPARPAPEVPADLAAALRRNRKARATFEAFSPSGQREYIEWITEAKRPETRESRLLTTLEWLSEGKKRNWKYQNC